MSCIRFSAVDCIQEAAGLIRGSKMAFFLWWLFQVIVITPVVFFISFIFGILMRFIEHGKALPPSDQLVFGILGLIYFMSYIFSLSGYSHLGLLRIRGAFVRVSQAFEIFNLKLVASLSLLVVMQIFISCIIGFIWGFVSTLLIDFTLGKGYHPWLNGLSNVFLGLTCVYIYLRISLAWMIILAERMNPFSAMMKSFKATRSHILSLLLLGLFQLVFAILSIFTFYIAYIWTLPLCFISSALAYRQLVLGETKSLPNTSDEGL